MSASGERMTLRQRISSKDCARSIKSIRKKRFWPLVVIDVHAETATNPDYTLSLERMKKWEKEHGEIPSGAFVAMRTGLVEALAGCRKNGKQGRQRRRALSWMELDRAKISLLRSARSLRRDTRRPTPIRE